MTLALMSGVNRDTEGYLQSENVWMYPTLTNRRGIVVVGGLRSPENGHTALEEARAAALVVYELIGRGYIEVGNDIMTVDTGKCAICLTCLRSCPHGAIRIALEKSAAEIVRSACYGCGICLAVCPARAITPEELHDDDLLKLIEKVVR